MNHRCVYCYYWIRSSIVRRIKKKSKSTKKKLKKNEEKKLKKNEETKTIIKRKCQIKKKIIDTSSKSCKNFSPIGFFCDNYNIYLKFIQCLNRRRNSENLTKWADCKKCRQFEKEIKEIADEYFLNAKKVRNPSSRIIKRRKTKPVKIIKKRKIKRRDHNKKKEAFFKKFDKTNKKKIKRRKNSTVLKTKPRKIKRRTKWERSKGGKGRKKKQPLKS